MAGCPFGGARRGFTLVEILMVIAIISVLAGLVFAVFPAVRERGRTAVCASNLRQIGIALIAYAADNDGFAPPFHTHEWPHRVFGDPWPWESSEGLVHALECWVGDNRLWFCPSDPYAGEDDWTWGHWHKWTSYEAYFGNGAPPWPYPLPPGWKPKGGGDSDRPAGELFPVAVDANRLALWGGQHRGRINLLYWDGSVQTVPVYTGPPDERSG